MSPSEYTLLGRDSSDLEDEKTPLHRLPIKMNSAFSSKLIFGALTVLLFMSLCTNIILAGVQIRPGHRDNGECQAPYAGLVKDFPIPYSNSSVYLSENRTAQDNAWDSIADSGPEGVIALSDEIVEAQGLPRAQRWPWDHNKGIYLVNGYHQLHCVHMIRQTLHELWEGEESTYLQHHVDHCLENLREEVVCQADDTPRYTGRINAQSDNPQPISGVGQNRRCRDWGKLREWAMKNSACYKRMYEMDENLPLKDRYKFCPDGSIHWPVD